MTSLRVTREGARKVRHLQGYSSAGVKHDVPGSCGAGEGIANNLLTCALQAGTGPAASAVAWRFDVQQRAVRNHVGVDAQRTGPERRMHLDTAHVADAADAAIPRRHINTVVAIRLAGVHHGCWDGLTVA